MAPLFSIVIPTRNRPHLLRYALQSALEQNFDDYEVVVSDNSTEGSAKAVTREFDHSRLRYIQTNSDLSMPDSWEFALAQARGHYTTYLPDDDALLPSLLATVCGVLDDRGQPDLVMWSPSVYFHPTWPEVSRRNCLYAPAVWTDQSEECDSRERLAALYRFESLPLPAMLNSVCSRSLIHRIRHRAGRVFIPPAPDYSFAALALDHTRYYLCIDRPLSVGGSGIESIGASQLHGNMETVTSFVTEFGAGELLSDVPIPVPNAINVIAQTLLNVLKEDERFGQGRGLDLTSYFIQNYRQLQIWQDNKIDIRPAMKLFWHAVSLQPNEIESAVKRRLRGQSVKRSLRRGIKAVPSLSRMELWLRPSLRAQRKANIIFHGSIDGFSNILEAVRFLEQMTAGKSSIRRECAEGQAN